MRQIILISSLFIAFFTPIALGQTPDATSSADIIPTVTETVADKEVKNLKDKIANKVAELNKDKKAVVGLISEISNNGFKIKDDNNKEYSVKTDPELTKIYEISQNGKKEIKFVDLKKLSYIVISGILLDNNVSANFVYLDKPVIVKSGKITEINKDDYTIKVSTVDKDEYTLTIENFTKQEMINIKSLEVERTGFSKIKEGDTIHFVANPAIDEKNKNNVTVLRYLVIPQEYFLK